MKKLVYLLPVLLVGTICSVNAEEFPMSENHPILIIQDPSDIPDAPRMPAFNPFFAELMNGYVILGSSAPYGMVTVSLISTAGDNYSTTFDTEDGAILLPISGNTGSYTLQITTSSGTRYVGEFSI